ncbi:MAG TPA: LysR substrate-binding domain-containing protein [Verrucomicrobiales bacterium]|jgi:DNA-binding transcriptional LysR family regulator|nr:LysR substrate-binding domain-containing protein [Verrucomicrobiales bacterium]
MELRHLRYFIAVAEEQNVTRAAERLRVAQPSLSRQIRDLEEELGIALFEHRARAVRLTEAGRVFLTEAQAALQRVRDAVQTVKAVAGGLRGEIHVGYAPSLTVELLPRTLRNFQETHPGVKVHLHDISTQEMLRGLRENHLHIALLVQVSPKVLPGLVFEELQRQPVSVALHPTHPLAKTRRVGLEHLVRERLIAFTLADYPEYHLWLANLFAAFPHPPPVIEEHDSVTSLIAAVEAGRGVALISQRFDCLTGPRLKIRPLKPAPPPLSVGIAYRDESHGAATESFIAAARRANGPNDG